jgi:serine-type D-Ala-D-Ala carboxypeptidase (penicillin-binding protein 5/6)
MRPLRAVIVAVLVCSPVGPARAQSVPPPTPVPPNGSPSPYPTALETPRPSTRPPKIDAVSAILADLDSGGELWSSNPDERRPIASVTKIMTALLVLEAARPDEVVTASENAAAQGGAELGLKPGEELTVRELILALLLQSANDAAVALAEHAAGTVEGFVDGMNRRARRLGLHDTRFTSPSGLDDTGYSTARDLVAITTEAYRDATFARVAATKFARIPAPEGDPRRIQNRNALLWLYPGALGGKTGYTAAAGFCLVAAAERDGLGLVTVILGAPQAPWSDAGEILNYGFATWERRTVVDQETPLAPVEVDGRQIPVHAAGELSLLLRTDQDVDLEVRPDAGLDLPVVAGERVGELTVSGEDGKVGEISVVANRTVRPSSPASDDAPWWERAWDAVAGFFTRLFRAIFGD